MQDRGGVPSKLSKQVSNEGLRINGTVVFLTTKYCDENSFVLRQSLHKLNTSGANPQLVHNWTTSFIRYKLSNML